MRPGLPARSVKDYLSSKFDGVSHHGELESLGKFAQHAGRGCKAGTVGGRQFCYPQGPDCCQRTFDLLLTAKSQVHSTDDGMNVMTVGHAGNMVQRVNQPGMAAAQK